MPNYLRPRAPGATIFFTVCLARKGSRLLVDEICLLREAVRVTRHRRPFWIDAMVILPDHLHAVWTLPEDDGNFSDRWGAIKARFSKHLRLKHAWPVGCKPTLRQGGRSSVQPDDLQRLRLARSPSKIRKGDAGVWQRRFWEHHIRNEADYADHVRYCWSNPVKHGLVAQPEDWLYSSVHRDIREGRYAA